jgi:Holliday junction DNA helicase RuvA
VIGYIEGSIIHKEPLLVRVFCQGIGYEVHVPLSTYERIGEVGSTVGLNTYLHVKEDMLQLYGFMTDEEKEVFVKVIAVRGIGPRLALGILSSLPAQRFVEALQEEDIGVLSEIPGIGRRTAERMALDLRDRFPDMVGPVGRAGFRREEEEAIGALVALGFSATKARKSVREAVKGLDDEAGTEEIVKSALKGIR